MATQYVNNYDTAIKTISVELKCNARFKTYYDEMRETPECRKNDLKAFLIQPVQRIPRYELLLRELIRKTPPDRTRVSCVLRGGRCADGPADADFTPLNEAFTKIKAISALIDNRKDDNVKFQEVVRVHSLLEPKARRRARVCCG